uniref:FABP domain-containing protein n=1 Tax=Angiostrongylus cantonensis TaxID=6313 RepID=A0A0K0D5M5_ANGCA
MIQFVSVTKVIAKNEISGYNLENLSSKKNIFYHGWKLGETFEGDGLDGMRHNVTFDFANDTLTEDHVRLNDPLDKGETYRYNIDTEGKLVLVDCIVELILLHFDDWNRSVSSFVMNGVFVLTILTIATAIHAKELPRKFYGKYDLDHSENFDEYLEAKDELLGYDWFTRKLVTTATFKKEFKTSSKPGRFDYANLTSKKDVFYKDVELGKEFIGEGIDSTMHKSGLLHLTIDYEKKCFQITFDLVGDVLYEKHIRTEDGELKMDTYEYSFTTKNGKEYLLQASKFSSRPACATKKRADATTKVVVLVTSQSVDHLRPMHHENHNNTEYLTFALNSKMEADGVVGKRFYRRV